ncbi:MAG: prolyl oligopeptidase family serine peptidase [Woeseiaceae bacterium]
MQYFQVMEQRSLPVLRENFGMVVAAFAITCVLFPYQRGAAEVAPYGAWESPQSAADIFAGTDHVSELFADGDQIYFIEKRASADGRNVLVRLNANNTPEQLTDSAISIRSRVHEYGGRPYVVDGGNIYYSEFSDQKIYLRSADSKPQALTRDGLRYMECVVDRRHKQLLCVREDHREAGEPTNTLVAISLVGDEETILFQGTDFVRTPELSPDEKSVAFVTWSHPNMPWDDTQLRVLTFAEDGSARSVVEVPQSGGVSIKQPKYAADGTLYFVADFDNWWTLYRLNPAGQPALVLDQELEIQSYGIVNDTEAIITYQKKGLAHVARVDLANGEMTNIGEHFSSADSVTVASDAIYFRGATPSTQESIYTITGNGYKKIYEPSGPRIPAENLSEPIYITFPTGTNEEAYGFLYPPRNASFKGNEGSLPPLIVEVHGGPVSKATSKFEPEIQFWTSRGFAVFDVNHRGSTGYGRAFRKKLYPNWGIVDLEDASNGVQWLADNGYIDADRVAIRGGSAGGYTTLGAMAFRDTFKAGASYFGVSDLEVLTKETHKYESRYLDQLIGPYPEEKSIYLERSPIHSIDRIQEPLLLLQGLDDEVVPPNQSQMIFDALVENCVPVAYIAFEGEGHGFRKPHNKIKALNAELDFYGQVFGFEPAGDLERIPLVKCKE